MKILSYVLSFDWDNGNIDKNFKKHNVADRETEEVFENKQRFIFEDGKHSLSEKRYMIWGTSSNRKKLSIFFTIRKNKIRVISARDMNKKERREYEKKIHANSEIQK